MKPFLAAGASSLRGEGGGGKEQSLVPPAGPFPRERGPPGCLAGHQPLATVRDPGELETVVVGDLPEAGGNAASLLLSRGRGKRSLEMMLESRKCTQLFPDSHG